MGCWVPYQSYHILADSRGGLSDSMLDFLETSSSSPTTCSAGDIFHSLLRTSYLSSGSSGICLPCSVSSSMLPRQNSNTLYTPYPIFEGARLSMSECHIKINKTTFFGQDALRWQSGAFSWRSPVEQDSCSSSPRMEMCCLYSYMQNPRYFFKSHLICAPVCTSNRFCNGEQTIGRFWHTNYTTVVPTPPMIKYIKSSGR